MTAWQFLVYVGVVLALACLVGLLVRRRYRLCRALPIYLLWSLVTNFLGATWPERFHTWSFWIVKQAGCDVLRVVIALEMARVIFMAFPRPARAARRAMLGVLVLTLTAIITWPAGALGVHYPRLLAGTVWLFAALTAIASWYRVPLHPYHAAVMRGFVPYLVLLIVEVFLGAQPAWWPLVAVLIPLSYDILLAYWTWAAWRPETVPNVSPAVVRRLQPWRVAP